MSDPCFNCTLPDCDDTSRQCLLRQQANRCQHLSRQGEPVSHDLMAARNEWHRIWKIEDRARRSEQHVDGGR